MLKPKNVKQPAWQTKINEVITAVGELRGLKEGYHQRIKTILDEAKTWAQSDVVAIDRLESGWRIDDFRVALLKAIGERPPRASFMCAVFLLRDQW